jgi:hypothetical protein
MKKFITFILLLTVLFPLSAQPVTPVKSASPVNVEGSVSALEVKVFPNPVHHKRFTVELFNQQIQEIRISNIAGIQVYYKKFTTPVSRYQVLLGNIPNGIYLLKITSPGSSKTLKLLVSTSP